MKLISFAIPCYNSESYMENCIKSLLPGGEEVEIIIVDDGSTKDRTAQIADEYAAKYPTIIKAVHQENGGHGEAVNTGLRNATGLYYKVVDSDDKVDPDAYVKVLDTLRSLYEDQKTVDMMICNYVYDKVGQKNKKVMKYRDMLPKNRLFTWEDVKRVHTGEYILMHSVIYRTKLLKECGLELPKHTFYVDNIFVFNPLPYVKYMYYLDVNFYLYYIGREDQSVNESIMIGRIDQQIRVNKIIVDNMAAYNDKYLPRKLRKYMMSYTDIMMAVSSALLLKSGTKENLIKKKELWKYVRDQYPTLFFRLRRTPLGIILNLRGRTGRKISVTIYNLGQKIIGFN